MSTLYTIGNTNINTINLVAMAINELCLETGTTIEKIVILNTPLSHEVHQQQIDAYRKHLKYKSIIEIMIGENGDTLPEDFHSYFKNENEIIIDLTNGQKTTSAILFFAANLLSIDSIYYCALKTPANALPESPIKGIHYDYNKVHRIEDVSGFGKLSHFDMIYYIDELYSLCDNQNNGFFVNTRNELYNSIVDFFEGRNYTSSVTNATHIAERTIPLLYEFISEYEPARNFCIENNIKLDEKKDPVGVLTFFFKKYATIQEVRDLNLSSLITAPGILSVLRNYRNISVHPGKNPYPFKYDDARIVINLSLELIRIFKNSQLFWFKIMNA